MPHVGDPGVTFTAVVQIGTELAVVLFFAKDIARIIKAWCLSLPIGKGRVRPGMDDPDVRMGWIVIVGTIPIVVLGLLLEDLIDTVFRSMLVAATTLAVFAIFLALADKYGRKRIPLEKMSLRDGLILGFAQSMALIPGVSRSGGTITVGLLLGYTREAAARVSFLLAIPAVLGSGFYRLFTDDHSTAYAGHAQTIVATVAAFVVGFIVIWGFLKFISTNSYTVFVVYRILLSAAIFAMVGAGLID